MKVFFLGSVVSEAEVENILSRSRIKPSVAPVYFQNSLIDGMAKSNLDLTIYSLPPIKTFPDGNRFFWGSKKEVLSCRTSVTWLKTLNIFGFKQLTAYLSAKQALKRWLKENKSEQDKIVLSYSVYSPTAKAIIKLSKRCGCKNCAIITDSVDYVYKNDGKTLKAKLLKKMISDTKNLTNRFDGYVFLTKYMVFQYEVNNKPYIIMEGLSDPNLFNGVTIKQKEKTVMYSGVLSKGFGVDKLVKAFTKTKIDYDLLLFGSGDCENLIKELSKTDSRIKFMGRVDRETLLKSQLSATLLLSVKPSDEEHTKYAFPSKVIEYMTSGTPVLLTKVKGIPEEYFDYCYTIDDETVDGIAEAIEETLTRPVFQLQNTGEEAKKFVISKKNNVTQAQRIKSLLKDIIANEIDN